MTGRQPTDLAKDPEEAQNLASDRDRLQPLLDKLQKLRAGLEVVRVP
jgi:hypothetical protein